MIPAGDREAQNHNFSVALNSLKFGVIFTLPETSSIISYRKNIYAWTDGEESVLSIMLAE